MTRLLAVAVACLVATGPVRADEKVKIDDATKASIGKALAWLKDNQNPNGSWGRGGNTAVTSFGLLAFLSNGHVPGEGPFAPEVARAVRYLLSQCDDKGYLAGTGGGNMYCHGMSTLALTQVYGMSRDEEVRKVLLKAIALILRSQNSEGGWRYDPAPTAADISVTIMQVMALRGAKDSGLNVPTETLEKAVAYINRCHDPRTGGYRYQPFGGGPGYARTAAGVCVLQLSGAYEAKQIARAVEWMEETGNDNHYYWYGHYYASHAMHQVGGKKWEDYYERMKSRLLATQKPTGGWDDSRERNVGREYQTAIAVLILSVPANYLPIYQR